MMANPIRRAGLQPAQLMAVAIATLPGLAHADYLWLQREGAQAQVFAGEVHKPLAQLPALTEAKVVRPDDKPAPSYKQAADHFSFTPRGPGDTRFTATHAGADGVLTYYVRVRVIGAMTTRFFSALPDKS